jgi:DNA excision repair protein ERCC-3
MAPADRKPLIVQSDRTLFLEVDHPLHEEVRDRLLPFAELAKSPEHVHTYRITPISLWNAAAAGLNADDIARTLRDYSRYEVPPIIERLVRDQISRYGKVKLLRDDAGYYLDVGEDVLLTQIMNNRKVASYLEGGIFDERKVRLKEYARGHVKSALIRFGIPVEDLAGYVAGAPLEVALRETQAASGDPRPAAPGSSCCRAVPARPSWEWPPWPKSQPKPSSWLPTSPPYTSGRKSCWTRRRSPPTTSASTPAW